MKRFYLFTVIISMTLTVPAQTLVKDVNSTIAAPFYNSSDVINMTSAGNKTYYVANDASSGLEPWVTDGTAAGTHILRDINPGKTSSGASSFTYSNGNVYFRADDGTHGSQLWKTDGTAAGTVMVSTILYYGPSGESYGMDPSNLCDVNGVLYFAGENDPTALDAGIWKTDGTAAGTVFVNNLNTYNAFNTYNPFLLFNFNGTLYFTERNPSANYNALWRVTNAGVTELIKDDINATNFTIVGSTMFFTGFTPANGSELWKTDGSAGGTVLVKDINPGTSNGSPADLTNVNGTLFFTAWDGVNGGELWKSDGTAAGTIMIKDITTANNLTTNKPTQLCNVNGILFFNGYTAAANKELWKSDGTDAGTVLVKDIVPGSSSPGGNPVDLINNNGTLLFRSSSGNSLWKSDGTDAGTVVVKSFSLCQYLTAIEALPGNIIFYAGDASTGDDEIWKSDGTVAGTAQLKNVGIDNPASLYNTTGFPHVEEAFAHSNGKFFFSGKNANGSGSPYSFYSTEGTDATTIKLGEHNAGFMEDAVNAGGYIYFAFTNASGKELWKSDGTIAGTVMVKDINPGANSSSPERLFNLNGTIYFVATNGTAGIELWKTDGTAAGTVMVKDINAGSVSSNPCQFVQFNNALYFAATTAANGNELWKSDGTDAGTVMVKDISTGTSSSLYSPTTLPGNFFTVANNQLFFSALASSTLGRELWKTDGTTAGTVIVKDIANISGQSSDPAYITAVGNNIFFVADDYNFGTNDELWISDGSTAGTVKVKEINPGNAPSFPNNLVNLGGILYFSAYEPSTGYELWKSDGTTGGTVLVKDIEPGIISGMPSGYVAGIGGVEFKNIIASNGKIYFAAATAATGRELWQSDGTGAGTLLVSDLFAGPQSSDPEQITSSNGDIYFVGENGSTGKELYTFKPVIDFILPPGNGTDSININQENFSLIDGTNQIIATVKQSGIKPLNHIVKTKVTFDVAATNYNGRTLAKKHVDIEPVVDAATSTATVILYFSQADFDDYNVADNINGDLPTNASDALGKAALRIIQFHGVGTAPGNYPGAEEIINPADDSIVWNATANYWEVSFTVTGFSGFYLSSVAAGSLPVHLLSFYGIVNTQKMAALQWKVTEQSDIINYEIERSSTGNNFVTIASVNANTLNDFTYKFTDSSIITDKYYYRIKIIDANGRITYSSIIILQASGNNFVNIYPVPASLVVTIQTNHLKYLGTIATIKDNAGKIMQQQLINSNQQQIDVSRFSAGIYYVQLFDRTILKFQKL
ncbi:MAG: ELWxxDGT repeat protein [Ferruginibacter sp.]